jgi:hypothetical protein
MTQAMARTAVRMMRPIILGLLLLSSAPIIGPIQLPQHSQGQFALFTNDFISFGRANIPTILKW